jgi:hypothetical protein
LVKFFTYIFFDKTKKAKCPEKKFSEIQRKYCDRTTKKYKQVSTNANFTNKDAHPEISE